MMGWHKVLYNDYLLPLESGKVMPKPGPNALFAKRQPDGPGGTWTHNEGTPNFRWMGAAGWYGWALKFGTPADVEMTESRVLDLYRQEREKGLMLGEQTACDPHANFHLAAHAAIRTFAREADRKLVLAHNGDWWRKLHGVYKLGATPDGEILLPSTRLGPSLANHADPVTQPGTAIYRTFAGLPHLAPMKSQSFWKDEMNQSARMVRDLVEAGDDLGGALTKPELPRLRMPMVVVRASQGHFAFVEGSPVGKPTADWVKVTYGAPRHHTLEYGVNWATPRPEVHWSDVERIEIRPNAAWPAPPAPV
jgi:hypothetical protein